MPTDPKEMDEQRLNEILRNIKQPEDSVLEEAALKRALANIEEIGRADDPVASDDESKFVHLTRGDRLGDFVIDQMITQGGMGVIYSATQEPIGRNVALKTILPGRANALTLERFARERKILGELHESNIVSIFAAGTHGEIEYFAMPYIAGMSIRRLVRHIGESQGRRSLQAVVSELVSEPPNVQIEKQFPESDHRNTNNEQWRPPRSYFEEVVRLVIDLAAGVQAVHDANYIHRDITPNNVLVDTSGRPWLIDFGIASAIPTDAVSVSSPGIYVQSVDGRLGTPRYKAPELKENLAGRQTDVFGIGVCLYCLLTATDFSNDASDSGLLCLSNLSIPRPLAAVCQKALREDPADRYPSPQKMVDDLERWSRNEPVSSRAYPVLERARLWLKRNPVKAMTAAAGLVLVAVLSYALIQQQRSKLFELRSIVLDRDITDAAQFITRNPSLRINPNQNPDLFVNFAKLLIWTGQTSEAEDQINKARAIAHDDQLLARLDLLEAELRLAFDFEAARALAERAKSGGLLIPENASFAEALCSSKSLDEQRELAASLALNPFQLRAHQLLVLNYLFLGQKTQADIQLRIAKTLFPDDLGLKVAEALLVALAGDRERGLAILVEGKASANQELQRLLDSLAQAFPDPTQIQSGNVNQMMDAADGFLVGAYQLQPEFAKEGLFIFPPALFRSMTNMEGWEKEFEGPNDPRYWPALERKLFTLCENHPEGVFVFGLARALRAQQKPETAEDDRWYRAESVLELALETGSLIPVRDLLIQELALTRVEIFFHRSDQSDETKLKMAESLHLLDEEGLMPSTNRLCRNLVEGALKIEDFDLAESLASKWRRNSPENADAYSYSARVAMLQARYLQAYQWSSKAIELHPEHELTKVHRETRSKAEEALRQTVGSFRDPD